MPELCSRPWPANASFINEQKPALAHLKGAIWLHVMPRTAQQIARGDKLAALRCQLPFSAIIKGLPCWWTGNVGNVTQPTAQWCFISDGEFFAGDLVVLIKEGVSAITDSILGSIDISPEEAEEALKAAAT